MASPVHYLRTAHISPLLPAGPHLIVYLPSRTQHIVYLWDINAICCWCRGVGLHYHATDVGRCRNKKKTGVLYGLRGAETFIPVCSFGHPSSLQSSLPPPAATIWGQWWSNLPLRTWHSVAPWKELLPLWPLYDQSRRTRRFLYTRRGVYNVVCSLPIGWKHSLNATHLCSATSPARSSAHLSASERIGWLFSKRVGFIVRN